MGDLTREGTALAMGNLLQRSFSQWQRHTPIKSHWDADRARTVGLPLLFEQIGAREALYRLLDSAVKDRRITAWVLPSDFAARMALQYCRERSIAVPGKIAITGFCDSPDASTHRITSYNFNFNAVASSIINFLAHPSGVFWSRRRVVEIEGKVVERETG
jgi:DNA-binding LacI/PurR family transcriptional regulator